jgi:hypothetical protein
MKVVKGDVAVVVSGKKVPLGTTGKVFWAGETKYGIRVGLNDAAGATHWTAMGNVEKVVADAPVVAAPVAPVVAAAPTGPTLEAKVDALLALAEVLAKNVLALEAKVAALTAAAPAPFIPDGVDPAEVAAFTN